MNTKIMVSFSLLSAIAFGGCAGMTQKKDAAALEGVKKVAIIALSVDQPDRQGGLLGTHTGGMTTESEHINVVYNELAKAFSKQVGWQVVSLDKMRANDAVKADFDSTMKGFQNKMPPGQGLSRHYAPGIPDFDSARLLKPEGRQNLARALGVDAVVAMNIRSITKGFSIMGVGPRHLEAMAAVYIYRGNEQSPIWFETFTGDETKQSVSLAADKGDIDNLVVDSVRSAFEKIKL